MTLGTKEWAPNNENCCDGCEYDCRYCYAKKSAIQYGRHTKEDWHIMKPNARSKRPVQYREGGIMFPTTHDLQYEHHDWWMPFLTALLEKGNNVLIVTKSSIKSVELITNNLERFKDQIEFRFTIGTYNDETRQFWEPHAPTIRERILALQDAHWNGFKTSLSMEPLLDFKPSRLIDQIDEYVTGTIWIGLMNHMKRSDFAENEEYWYTRILMINGINNIRLVYEENKNNPKIRWIDSIRDLLLLGALTGPGAACRDGGDATKPEENGN